MTTYWIFLRNLLPLTCLAVPLGAMLASALWIVFGDLSTSGRLVSFTTIKLHAFLSLWMLFNISAALVGFLPGVLIGAPCYAYLAYKRRLTPLTLLAIGALPGAVLALFEWQWGLPFMFFGAVVACVLHGLARRDVRTLQVQHLPPLSPPAE